MIFMVCKSLFKSLGSLTDAEIKRVTADFIPKFYNNSVRSGISLERINGAKDKNLWSARITRDLRAIIYRDGDTWALMHAGHHDDAYAWATGRKVELNERTGALQIVEFTEAVEAELPEKIPEQPGLFDAHADDYLLSLGLPPNWLPVMRKLISEDDFLKIIERLPEEVQERFLRLAAGELVPPPLPTDVNQGVTENEDTQRRFITVKSTADLAKMLEAPLATWIGFLHPTQRRLVDGSFKGPVKITGSAGTGKTVVALHRARHLARQGKRVLLTTFVRTLCDNLQRNLNLLCTEEELANITVATVASQAGKILSHSGHTTIVDDQDVRHLISLHYHPDSPLDTTDLWLEWQFVIQPQGISSWNEYRSANRTGRGRAISVRDRKQVWKIFESVLNQLRLENKMDWGTFYRQATDVLKSGNVISLFDSVIVDETQDLKPQELKFLLALAGSGSNNLMLVGDGGQRIYQGKFSLKSLGIYVQGRSHILKINYRTTEQIRRFADRLVDPESDDLNGDRENRMGTVSLLQGPNPETHAFNNAEAQNDFIVSEIKRLLSLGLLPEEIAVFARTQKLLQPIETQLSKHSIPLVSLDEQMATAQPAVHLGTMHRAKGLEFKSVFVINVSDEIVPHPQSLPATNDSQVLTDALQREQNLLYVSITRARDRAYISWVGQPSRYLEEVLIN